LAVGGFLKAAVAWSSGAQSVLGPHVGDQESLAARERWLAHIKDWQKLYRCRAERFVYDMHPDYFSTQWVHRQAGPSLAVQHHHAHVAAGMLEHGWLDRRVLGVAWDGTGYGPDGTIWGGEFLDCSPSTFQRVARIRPFSLPGGEAAIREPWRVAASICGNVGEPVDLAARPGWSVTASQLAAVVRIVDRRQFSPLTSSAGRLFDAAAALALGCERVDFEGQAAMRLEAVADRSIVGQYDFPLRDGPLPELDWRPLFAQLLADHRRGAPLGVMAMRVHRSFASGIAAVCRRAQLPVVLSGGVFQNRLLTELVIEMMDDARQPLGLPGRIPPNDGGLAAGQLAMAAATWRDSDVLSNSR
jgi:hydrogenase maturation protein HypF